jgi:phosphotransferase system  glucose/maltose/N-acetylglucosamine-specific IIC component
MNPALTIIVILLCIAVWFLASSLYKPIGRWIGKILQNVIKNTKNESEE